MKIPTCLRVSYVYTENRIGVRCMSCSHIWTPHQMDMPRICPSCKTKKWYSKDLLIENLLLEK